MNWLAENSLAIWMGGAVALTMALVVYFQTRTNRAALGILGVVVATAALVLLSWMLETPREAVERNLYSLAATVEANDVPGVRRYLAPSADPKLRKDIEELMPLVQIELARIIDTPQIDLDGTPDPTSATVRCQGVVRATNKKDGMKGGAADRFVLHWVRRGDRWLIESYTSQQNWPSAVRRPNSGGN